MTGFPKIRYYDLQWEALEGRLKPIVGRYQELARITRVVERTIHNNCIIVGFSGVGKTALLHGWVRYALERGGFGKNQPIVQIDTNSFSALASAAPISLQRYSEAMESLPGCTLILDDFGEIVYNKPALLHSLLQLLKPIAERGAISLLLVMEQKEHKWIESEQPHFLGLFETITIKPQVVSEQYQILEQFLSTVSEVAIEVAPQCVLVVVELVNRFPALGCLPAAAIRIMDECLAFARSQKSLRIRVEDIYRIVSEKIGVPLNQLNVSERERLKTLEQEVNTSIIGQRQAIAQIVSTIQRAKLGLKNPRRPLGSFLVLGPSGVGKTETAKLVAEKIFGKKESFVRIDMSEFGEAHTVARLIGAPAGYVGFEEGGGLTNAVKKEPHSLILLDEAEKAHSKIFDIFLQILDDGRLTSGQGETIDFTQTIIMATTNIAVAEIIEGFRRDENIHNEDFFHHRLVPALTQVFRLEFLNRFDAILVFNPLTEEDLLTIAKLEIRKVEKRVAQHRVAFAIDPAVLSAKISALADPRFGARPVKRFIETTCERLVTQKLLQT